jgi:carbon-monoxide dehydrogenase large subunit
VADEAYRAVFLRVHPTGKMVLSLTTESDGNETRYAERVASALGVPPLDVKVVPADTNRFGVGHGFNTTPSPGLDAAIDSTSERILAKARLLAGADLQTPPDELTWADGAFVADGQTRTIADVALYAHGSGALPPGVEGGLDAQTVFAD